MAHSLVSGADLAALMAEAGELAQDERKRLRVEVKADGSLVTQADRAVEEFLIPRLRSLYPAAIVGEEGGAQGDISGPVWLIDPIDGTSNFWFGVPLWGVSVGLRVDNAIVAGGVILPDLGENYIGIREQGATLNGKALRKLGEGPLQPYELIGFGNTDSVFTHGRILGGKMRHLGALVAEAMFVASGRMRAMTIGRASLYDAAGSIAVLRELGAEFWDFDLNPVNPDTNPAVGLMAPLIVGAPGILDNGARERLANH
ncbi:MAG: inositol monophosphatase [Fimbriimonadaceae bacterium]|nr:inositol monophosphatase [Fimbriimonadaceae bacterium]